jgi:tol-pal system protein YbgF
MSVHTVQCRTKDKAQGDISLRFSVLKTGACTFALAALLMTAPAQAQTDMRTRMKQLENQMETLSQQVANPVGADAAKDSLAQTQSRLSQIDSSLSSLTGKIEEQQHYMQKLQDSITRIEQRLTVLEQRAPGNAVPSEVTSTTTTVSETAAAPSNGLTAPSELHEGDLGQPPQPEPATATPATNSGFTGGVAKPADPDAPATAQTTPETSLGTLTKPESPVSEAVKPANTPEAAYEAAYTELKNQNYDAAEKAFKDFLAKNPKDKLAANAQYWLGESYYARAQFAPAAKAFASAYQKYPQSTKGPDALLKMGMSLNGMGDKNSACLTFSQLKKQFPTAKQSISLAQDESAKLGCK